MKTSSLIFIHSRMTQLTNRWKTSPLWTPSGWWMRTSLYWCRGSRRKL